MSKPVQEMSIDQLRTAVVEGRNWYHKLMKSIERLTNENGELIQQIDQLNEQLADREQQIASLLNTLSEAADAATNAWCRTRQTHFLLKPFQEEKKEEDKEDV